METSVHLALLLLGQIITLILLLRQDIREFYKRSRAMQKSWEELLGQWVLFVELEDGGWQWRTKDLDVRHDPSVRFPSLASARIACGAMIYAFFVMEEATSKVVPPFTSPSDARPLPPDSPPSPPPHGSGGG